MQDRWGTFMKDISNKYPEKVSGKLPKNGNF
jgi:hypothetical protein